MYVNACMLYMKSLNAAQRFTWCMDVDCHEVVTLCDNNCLGL